MVIYHKDTKEVIFEGTSFVGVDLSYANLSNADLRYVNMSHTNLSYANLSNAYLISANLKDVDLSCAYLGGAYLCNADLRGVNLKDADLSCADISNANLRHANLSGVKLYYTNLSNAYLGGAKIEDIFYNSGTSFFALSCPEEGSFVGFKKCRDDIVIKLLITEDAKRSSATSRKCRASKVEVLDIFNAEEAYSIHDQSFKYRKGDIIEVPDFDEDRWMECSTGIHFFLTKEEAENYHL